MSDPLRCLRISSITIALWNLIYSLIQIGIFGWQIKFCRDRQWELENRNSEIPDNPVDRAGALHPGLYDVYSETPEKRRINVLFGLAITSEVAACAHLCLSIVLLIGAIKYYANCLWPWILSAGIIIALSTAYAVLWWSGDVFGEQLAVSVAEFVMSLAINGICTAVVAFYFFRVKGMLTSVKPKDRNRHQRQHLPDGVAEWRKKWSRRPPKMLEKKLRNSRSQNRKSFQRSSSKDHHRSGRHQQNASFGRMSCSPEVTYFKYTKAPQLNSSAPIPNNPHYLPVADVIQNKEAHKQNTTPQQRRATFQRPHIGPHYNWLYLSQQRLNAHNAHFEPNPNTLP